MMPRITDIKLPSELLPPGFEVVSKVLVTSLLVESSFVGAGVVIASGVFVVGAAV